MKRNIAFLLIIVLLTNMVAFADDNIYSEVKGDKTPEEGCMDNPSDFYRNDKELNPFHDILNQEQNNSVIPLYVPPEFERYLDVPMYLQKNNDYCGPACVEMIIDFYRGSVNSQEIYAEFMGTGSEGTDHNMVCKALNHYQDNYHYDIRYVGNFQAMIDKAYYSLRHGAPFVANINTTALYNNNDWAYSTTGHYIVIRSIYYDKNTERFTGHVNDSWRVGKCKKTYQVLYKAVADHWNSSIIH